MEKKNAPFPLEFYFRKCKARQSVSTDFLLGSGRLFTNQYRNDRTPESGDSGPVRPISRLRLFSDRPATESLARDTSAAPCRPGGTLADSLLCLPLQFALLYPFQVRCLGPVGL